MERRNGGTRFNRARYTSAGIVTKKDDVRITVRQSVYLPNANWDPICGALPDRTSRSYTYEKKLRSQKEKKTARNMMNRQRPGVSRGMALAISLVWLLILLAFPGTVIVQMQADQHSLDKLNLEIKSLRANNAVLQDELAAATDDMKIRYAAAQNLGMIPSEAATAVEITVPEVPVLKAWETTVKSNDIYARIYSALDRP